jgi:hypothetical protein
LLFALFSTVAEAKCADELYEVGGDVTNVSDSSPIAGAEIVITWKELAGSIFRNTTAKTNLVGHYRARIHFYPWSGEKVGGGDECRAKLSRISLTFSASGFDSGAKEQEVAVSPVMANYSLKRTAANRHGVD